MKMQALAQIPETERAGGAVVRISNVVKVYKAGDVEVSAIKGITFDIPRQRFSMIVGPSGSGKTTLLNLIGSDERRPLWCCVGTWVASSLMQVRGRLADPSKLSIVSQTRYPRTET